MRKQVKVALSLAQLDIAFLLQLFFSNTGCPEYFMKLLPLGSRVVPEIWSQCDIPANPLFDILGIPSVIYLLSFSVIYLLFLILTYLLIPSVIHLLILSVIYFLFPSVIYLLSSSVIYLLILSGIYLLIPSVIYLLISCVIYLLIPSEIYC